MAIKGLDPTAHAGDLEARFAGVDAFDDFLDGFVFDQQVADFYGGEDLADQVGRWRLFTRSKRMR